LDQTSDTSDLKEFLEFIYGEQTGYSYILLIERPSGAVTQKYYKWPEECSSIIRLVSGQQHNGHSSSDIYYSPALFSDASGKREHFKTSQVLWCEFDGNAPIDLGSNLQSPIPSLRIQSSVQGHEHWYWRLSAPLTDSKVLEEITSRIAYSLSADHCWNANRVLRPPGTTHVESGQQVKILHQTSKKNAASDFLSLKQPPSTIINFTVGAIPKVLDVIAKYKWDSEPWALFMSEAQKVGSRSSALTKVAMHCVEMGMSNAETLAILYNADDRWEKFKGRGDRKERLTSLARYARGHAIGAASEVAKTAFRVFDFVEFLEEPIEFTWAIPNVLPEQGIALVAGEPGVGKTQFSLQTAIHLALGEPLINWDKPTREYKTVIFSLEMVHAHLKDFLLTMKKDLSPDQMQLLKQNLKLVPLGQPLNLDKPEDQAKVSEVMELHKPDGIVIDSLGQAMVGLNDDESVNRVFGYLRGTISSKYHAFSWLIHFPRKEQVGNRKPKRLDDLYGSRYIGGQIDTGLLLWKLGDSIELSSLKNRLAKDERPITIERTENLNFRTLGYGKNALPPLTEENKDNNIWGDMFGG